MKLLFIIFLIIIISFLTYYFVDKYNNDSKNKETFDTSKEFERIRDIDWALGDWFCKQNPNHPLCKKIELCKKNPSIAACQKLDFDIKKYCQLNPKNCIPNIPEKKENSIALCFSGGGSRSMSSHHGIMTSILKKIRNNNQNANYNTIFKNVDTITGISGGAWYLGMLLYNKQFNDDMNSILNIGFTKNNVFNIYKTKYTNIWYNKRISLENIQEFKDLLDLPFFIEFFIEVLDRFSGMLKFVIPWVDFVGKTILLDRVNNIKIKNCLEPFRKKDILFGSSIMINGNVDIKTTSPLISYSLKSPICKYNNDYFPCYPGAVKNSMIRGNTVIQESSGNNFNDVYWWYGYGDQPIGNANFDNTVFDTCSWTEMYNYDFSSGQVFPAGLRTWRCFNVACAECCRNNSLYRKCPMVFPVSFSSRDSVPFSFYNDIPVQYFAYNYETEKKPTGNPNYFDLIDTNSRRVMLYDRNGINFDNYNSSNEYVSSVVAASSGFASFANEPCYIKPQFYGSGWSDQEKIVNKLMVAISQIGIPILALKNYTYPKIFKNPCSIEGLCSTNSCDSDDIFCKPNPSFDWKNILNKVNEKQILRLGDGGNVDGLGILSAINNHMKKDGYKNDKGTINILSFVSSNFDSSTKVSDIHPGNLEDEPRKSDFCTLIRAVFKNYNPYPDAPEVYDIASKDMLCDLGKSISNTINGLAEASILEEIGIIIGSALVTAIVDSILVIVGGILGATVAIGLTAYLTDVVYELIDMDTDDHLLNDYYGKRFDTCSNLYLKPTIFNHNFNEPTAISKMISRDNNRVRVNIIKYKNIKTIENDLLKIDKDINVNLYILQSFLDSTKYPRAVLLDTNIKSYDNYADLVANVFDAFSDISLEDNFREIIELLQ